MESNIPLLPGHSSATALFQPMPTDDAEEYVADVEYQPTTTMISPHSCVEFNIKETEFYLDLSKTTLSASVRIVRQDGQPMSEGEDVVLANNSLWSVFGACDMMVGDVNVNPISCPLMSIKSYIDTVLERSEQVQETYLSAQGYTKDTPGSVGVVSAYATSDNPEGGTNRGLNIRHARTSGGRTTQLEGLVPIDLLSCQRYLLYNVPLHFRFRQNPDSFRLLSGDPNPRYTLHFENVVLRMRRVKLTAPVLYGHSAALENPNTRALYPHYQSAFRTYPMAQNDMSFSIDNLFNNAIPTKTIFAIIPSRSFNGDIRTNPYELDHADISSIEVSVDGKVLPAGRPLTFDFDKDMYTQGFLSIFKGMHYYGRNVSCDLELEDYAHGYFMVMYDFDSHPLHANYLPKSRQGHLRVELRFHKGLSQPMTLVAYARFPRCLQIDGLRQVSI